MSQHKTHYLDLDADVNAPACGQQGWHKIDRRPDTVTCRTCLAWIERREFAYREPNEAAEARDRWLAAVNQEGPTSPSALLLALTHAIDCEGGFTDGCGDFFGYMDCPFCEAIRSTYQIPES